MPRLTYEPAGMSRAIAEASNRDPGVRGRRARQAPDVGLSSSAHLEDPVDENARCDHVLRIDLTDVDNLRDLGDRQLGGSGHDRTEIAGGLAVQQVSRTITDVGGQMRNSPESGT